MLLRAALSGGRCAVRRRFSSAAAAVPRQRTVSAFRGAALGVAALGVATLALDEVVLPMPLAAVRRAGRTVSAVGRVSFDYWLSLRSIDRAAQPDAYLEALSACHAASARRLLKLAQTNGGVYIKIGQQLVALRPAVPAEYCDVLGCLMDAAPASSRDDVQRVLREERRVLAEANPIAYRNGVRGELEELSFAAWEDEPVGVASLAQVHRATLPSGLVVAVKVQHRRLRRDVDTDTAVMAWLASAVNVCFADFDLSFLVPIVRDNLRREINFLHEAANAQQCELNFRDNSQVHVPAVYGATERLLVMEYVDAPRVDDLAAVAALGLRPPMVSSLITNVFSTMVFEHGFVHCDPHPGNLLVRPMAESDVLAMCWRWLGIGAARPQLVVLDHGLYRVMAEDFRRAFCRLWHGMAMQSPAEVQQAADGMGMGKYAALLPVVFTNRSLSSNTRLGERLSQEERVRVREELNQELGWTPSSAASADSAAENDKQDQQASAAGHVMRFLEALPEDFLFVMRTFNLVRVLSMQMGGDRSDRLSGYAYAASRGLAAGESRSTTADAALGARVAKLLGGLEFRLRLFAMELLVRLHQWWRAAERDPTAFKEWNGEARLTNTPAKGGVSKIVIPVSAGSNANAD